MRADHDFYLGRLYPMQDRILARLAPIETGFYLTGGTAASRAYLHHRFSDDLDLLVNDDDRFVRLTVTEADIVLKIEMVYDVPAHGGELKRDSVLGPLDSAENILANKLTAAVDREEPRDLADIWGFCCQLNVSCEAALEGVQSTAVSARPRAPVRWGTDEPWRISRSPSR